MARKESNPLKELGIDVALIKTVTNAGGVEALKTFVGGYKRVFSVALHPDKVRNKTANEKLTSLNASADAVLSSPDLLVEQWVKGMREKKQAVPDPLAGVARNDTLLKSLIKERSKAMPFWRPARYIVEQSAGAAAYAPYAPLTRKMGMITNDGENLTYQSMTEVSTGQSFIQRTTIRDDIAMAAAYPELTQLILGEKSFLTERGISFNGFLEVRRDGTSTLSNKEFQTNFHDVLPTDRDSGKLMRAGIYMIHAASGEEVQKRVEVLGSSVAPGPALAEFYPSVIYDGEPESIGGTLIGFVGMDYRKALGTYRKFHSIDTGSDTPSELKSGELAAFGRSVTVEDAELAVVGDYYKSHYSNELDKKPSLLIARDGQAALIDRVVAALPLDTSVL